jgi:hypothetical protein
LVAGSSPKEVHAESEDEVVDRIQSAFAIGSVSSLPSVVPVQQPQTLDWIFDMGVELGGVNRGTKATSAPVPNLTAPLVVSSSSLPSVSQAKVQPRVANETKRKQEQEEREKREKLKAAFFEKMKHRKAADLVQGIKTFATQFLEKPPPDSDRKCEVVRNFLQVVFKFRSYIFFLNEKKNVRFWKTRFVIILFGKERPKKN